MATDTAESIKRLEDKVDSLEGEKAVLQQRLPKATDAEAGIIIEAISAKDKQITALRTDITELRRQSTAAGGQVAAGPFKMVTIRVEVVDEELGKGAGEKITLQVSDSGQKQLEGKLRRWDSWGLWDGVSLTPSGKPDMVSHVDMLQDGADYQAIGSSSKGFKRIDRQLHKAGKKHELELEKALERELSELGVEARPDLHQLEFKDFCMELDSVVLGKDIAFIAEHEESAPETEDGTFKIVDEVCRKAEIVSILAKSASSEGTKFAAFQGRHIKPAVMYKYVNPKLQPVLQRVCESQGVLLMARNGKSIRRVPAVKPVASLGTAKRIVPSARLL